MTITEFDIGPPSTLGPGLMAAGPDGNVWSTVDNTHVARTTTLGSTTHVTAGFTGHQLAHIARGPDGNMWASVTSSNRVARITPSGTVTEFVIAPPGDTVYPAGITAGPDGNIWFTEQGANRIGRLTPAGVLTEFPGGISSPSRITQGPDGGLWFTESNRIGRISTSGVFTLFSTGITPSAGIFDITAGPDGALWFTETQRGAIGRITTSGVVSEFTHGISSGAQPTQIATGPDGNLWFTEPGIDRIARITPSGVVTEFSALPAASGPVGMALGPDGNLWFTERRTKKVARLVIDAPSVTVGDATGVTPSGATLLGTVNPKFEPSAYHFEYGITDAYGSTTDSRDVEPGSSGVTASSTLAGLLPETTYHYRLVVSSQAGTVVSEDRTFRTAISPDRDRDGFLPPVDCNDANAAVHPGATDDPGDDADEDCVDGPRPFSRIGVRFTVGWVTKARFTRFTRLTLTSVPGGATVRLSCRGVGCKFKPWQSTTTAPRASWRLPSRFGRSRLRRGARLELRVTQPATIGLAVRWKVRSPKRPSQTVACLVPGAKSPSRC